MSAPFFIGDPAPYFTCRTSANPRFKFDTVAGRYLVLCFIGSAATPAGAQLANVFQKNLRSLFDDIKISGFLISTDPTDESEVRIAAQRPGVHVIWDEDKAVSLLYGAIHETNGQEAYFTLVLDPMLRVVARFSHDDVGTYGQRVRELLDNLPALDAHAGVTLSAPILVVPRVFERSFCQELMAYYAAHDTYESGFMRERDGKTVLVNDPSFKRRHDCDLEDEALKQGYRARLIRRLIPEIQKAFQFKVTHIERYIVARYSAEELGFFRPHRDNTTKGTAHRRFACTINLNAEAYEGGELRFPEFGSRTYRAPTGGAVVFSCSLLHEATPVTKGVRFATLPFLYDEASSQLRRDNVKFLEE